MVRSVWGLMGMHELMCRAVRRSNFQCQRHAVNSSSLDFNFGFWMVSFPWSSADIVFFARNHLTITVLVSSYVSAMEDTLGVRTTKTVAEFGSSSIPHTGPEELEFMTCYLFLRVHFFRR